MGGALPLVSNDFIFYFRTLLEGTNRSLKKRRITLAAILVHLFNPHGIFV